MDWSNDWVNRRLIGRPTISIILKIYRSVIDREKLDQIAMIDELILTVGSGDPTANSWRTFSIFSFFSLLYPLSLSVSLLSRLFLSSILFLSLAGTRFPPATPLHQAISLSLSPTPSPSPSLARFDQLGLIRLDLWHRPSTLADGLIKPSIKRRSIRFDHDRPTLITGV